MIDTVGVTHFLVRHAHRDAFAVAIILPPSGALWLEVFPVGRDLPINGLQWNALIAGFREDGTLELGIDVIAGIRAWAEGAAVELVDEDRLAALGYQVTGSRFTL